MSMPADKNYFKDYPNPCFVESGSFTGDSIDLALQAGFQDIRAIEINPKYVDHCRDRFFGKPVVVFQGDSAEMLYEVIRPVTTTITFWLDSHFQMLEGEEPGANPWPLFKELQQIARHPIKSHTIIIDDILHLTHPKITRWTHGDIEMAIREINPAYRIKYVANPVINNILIATV